MYDLCVHLSDYAFGLLNYKQETLLDYSDTFSVVVDVNSLKVSLLEIAIRKLKQRG